MSPSYHYNSFSVLIDCLFVLFSLFASLFSLISSSASWEMRFPTVYQGLKISVARGNPSLKLPGTVIIIYMFKFKFKFIYSHLFSYNITTIKNKKEVKNRANYTLS